MQEIGQQVGQQTVKAERASSENRKRVETVVETLAKLRSEGESLQEVAHDARNMVTALGLYCDLLEEPGVLAAPFAHYGSELRLVASASRRLVEKLVDIDTHTAGEAPSPTPSWFNRESGRWPLAAGPSAAELQQAETAAEAAANENRQIERGLGQNPDGHRDRNRRWDLLPAMPVANLAAELLANRNLLSAMAGPAIALTVDTEGGAQPVRLTGEDLTRVLVNMVKNAAEAMPAGGRIRMTLSERPAAMGTAASVALVIEDNGPGIPQDALERIFASGFTTRGKSGTRKGGWQVSHRGLGLAITRSIVEAAGGRVFAANREQGGARFEIELPVRKARY
jgi:signal transduction histidine kinase